MKELPSAEGHTGAAVAGACTAEDETVTDKLADAGTFDVEEPETAAAGLLEETDKGLTAATLIVLEILVLEDKI